MRRTFLQALGNDRGAVSTLAAVSIFPIVAAAGLLIDSGSAWIFRNQVDAALDAAAAISAMHRPACADGQPLPAGQATAVVEAATGITPNSVEVICTSDGIVVTARIPASASLMSIVVDDDLTVAARARAIQATSIDNDAGGWRRP